MAVQMGIGRRLARTATSEATLLYWARIGEGMVRVLRQRDFPIAEIDVRARRERIVKVDGEELLVRPLDDTVYEGTDLVLMAADDDAIPEFAWKCAAAGAIVVDNSSTWRMDPRVPLIVPSEGAKVLIVDFSVIANPNCSTIQMVAALAPLHRRSRIRRIIVSTYQSVSGTGRDAMEELRVQNRAIAAGEDVPAPRVYPRQIAGNVIPQIGSFRPDGMCNEEWKMVGETQKILHDDDIAVTSTTVRVPSMIGHAESVYIETQEKITAKEAEEILRNAPGIVVCGSDGPFTSPYPTPIDSAGTDPTFVGRIREDPYAATGLNLWIVADNLRKGAALNAVQVAELLAP